MCRREKSKDVEDFYTDDFHRPHRDFVVRELRRSMAVVVEVCWHEFVWKEVERELGSRLVRFHLRVVFKPVRLLVVP
jgi:hypothetical protein